MHMQTRNVKTGLSFLLLFSVAQFFFSCDSVEDDMRPNGPTVTIEGGEVYVMPDGTAYIDLYSKIKANGVVSLDIESLPKHGTLTEVATGLLKYSPNNDFLSGRDQFSFSVLGAANDLLKTDTIDIIVTDSLDLPCAIYPHDDWVFSQESSVELNVLLNDYICGDSTDVKLEVYRPEPNYPPYNGSAVVTSSNTILYTSNGGIVEDKVLYKVSRKSDASIIGFATAYISRMNIDTCNYYLGEVEASYQTQALIDSMYIELPDTIIRCNRTFSDLAVEHGPSQGTYSLRPPGIYYYFELSQQNQMLTDSIRYLLCADQDCLSGAVRIKINH
jgi:hypothetical protein